MKSRSSREAMRHAVSRRDGVLNAREGKV